ncbi:DUF1361 domain-containing protein [Seonamhaeicola maritimus]|uniref:DUF1361 domain-containing protein n=1 Tax=Seonamhaeicola maritimus TaxID=2591822 RepID=A0A5C7GKA5_9FLAO|nr:DUF1361 domain-containing protein [Seonamhaeicola maritimus]TXG38758.1 DUF1361 domain-containing protein [Seonamhaeicola maritimus]
MNNIKQLIFSQFKTFSLLSVSIVFSIVLLMIRMKLTHSFFYLFLVWNVFLAVIPFAITTYLVSLPKLNKLKLIIWFGVWLLFLPNAPYIITDLLHLKISNSHLLWLDILVISSFALVGLMLFYLSMVDMKTILQESMKSNYKDSLIIFIHFLCGFGVYLGRYLRYNSWEIVQDPISLFTDILEIIHQPSQYYEAWLFTLLFGAFLTIGYWVFQNFKYKSET